MKIYVMLLGMKWILLYVIHWCLGKNKYIFIPWILSDALELNANIANFAYCVRTRICSLPVADLLGQFQPTFSQFHAVLAKSYFGAPWRVDTPPTGKSGSDSGFITCTYIHVVLNIGPFSRTIASTTKPYATVVVRVTGNVSNTSSYAVQAWQHWGLAVTPNFTIGHGIRWTGHCNKSDR